jgi:hypothetical protein
MKRRNFLKYFCAINIKMKHMEREIYERNPEEVKEMDI